MIEPTLKFDSGFLVVQSCDSDWANIGVFSGARSVYYHVSVPGLERKYQGRLHCQLSPEAFDKIVNDNRAAILDLISRLNEVAQ